MRVDRRHGFSVPELAVGVGVLALFFGAVMMLSTQLNRNFTKGEATAVSQQELGLFLGALRQDMINCMAPAEYLGVDWKKAIVAEPGRLRFHVYADDRGAMLPVEWTQEGNRVRRSCQGNDKTYIRSEIASFAWRVETEVLTGRATGVRQMWLDVQVSLRGPESRGALAAAPVSVKTKMFPRRLNRLLNKSGA